MPRIRTLLFLAALACGAPGAAQEPHPAAPPLAAPEGAQPAAGTQHPSPGYFYSPYDSGPGYSDYFAATGGRSPSTWGGPWGYGDDCHLGAFRAEYLMWFSRGRNTPPLVSTSPQTVVDPNQAGVLGQADTSVLYGDEPIGQDMRSGGRFTLSRLLADEWTFLEGRFFGVEDSTERFFANSNGDPILARPFSSLGVQDAVLVAFPGIATGGSVNVLSKNDLIGADLWLRRTWSNDGCTRLDFLAGYQFARIDDSISINSTTTSIDPAGPLPVNTVVSLTDRFATQNEFHGAQLGLLLEARKDAWSLEVLGKVGLGNMRQRLAISGATVIDTPNAPPGETAGGLLAAGTNTRDVQRNQFAAVPEVNINGCYNFSPTWKIWAGYTFIYYSNVVLAGDQIDLALPPAFRFNRSDFLIQGLNLGAEYRW